MVNIPDSEISNLNAIMLGFSSTDLQTLPISSIGSVQKLGTLDGWSSSQVYIFFFKISYYRPI